MNRPTLSIVMPVYNVAAYLPACLDSLVAQTRQPDEIIAIDDGCTDDCPAILASYAEKLPQMRVVRQANGGLSAARNTGLKNSSGDWLVFLDSDDRLAPEHCATALDLAQTNDLDIALFNGWFDFEGRRAEELIYADEPDTPVMTGADWLRERLQRRHFFHFVWLHLYRRSFIDELGLHFFEPWIHEDVPWSTRVLLEAKRVRYSAVPLVHYRKPLRPSSPGPARDARLKLLIDSSAFNARALDKLLSSVTDPALRQAIAWQLVDGGLTIFHHLKRVDSRATLRTLRRQLRQEGLLALLWKHASTLPQHRRIARQWLKSFL